MADWSCPADWKIVPKKEQASDAMLLSIIFGDIKRFREVRNRWFCRCNASGKLIWPLQKMFVGIVNTKMSDGTESFADKRTGHYQVAYLTKKQYVIQKLKGVI